MINSKKNIDVVLLCGGKGQRLRPLTANTPKPLLLVNKKPFLYYMIRKFLKLRVNQIILATGYKSQKVRSFVNKFFKKNKNIILLNSGNVDIIKRLKDCSKFIKNDFFVCYGDTFASINLNKYIDDFNKKKKVASVVSAFYTIKYGTLDYNKKNFVVRKFKEKPTIQDPINLGYFLFRKSLIKNIKSQSLWVKFLENLSKSGKFTTTVTNKKYFSFDDPVEYNQVKKKIIK